MVQDFKSNPEQALVKYEVKLPSIAYTRRGARLHRLIISAAIQGAEKRMNVAREEMNSLENTVHGLATAPEAMSSNLRGVKLGSWDQL